MVYIFPKVKMQTIFHINLNLVELYFCFYFIKLMELKCNCIGTIYHDLKTFCRLDFVLCLSSQLLPCAIVIFGI
eukprot:c47825_g1_i1 orf=194-415(-)